MKNSFPVILLAFGIVLWSAVPAWAQPHGKKLLLEKITSAGCPGCPSGDLTLHSLLQNDTNLIAVALHVNNAGHVDLMACPDGDSILSDYLWAHPTVMVDRFKWESYPNTAMSSSFWQTMIDARKQMPMLATIGGTTTYMPGTRTLDITLNGTILWDLGWDLRVNAYLVEDEVTGVGLGYDQLNGNNNSPGHPLFGLGDPIVGYVHPFVLRDMLGGPQGVSIFPNPVAAGHPFSHTFQTVIDTAYNDTQCKVILVVQRHDPDPDLREVLNVVQLGLNGSVMAAVDSPDLLPAVAVWPNPSLGRLEVAVAQSGKWVLSLSDLQGRMVHTQTGIGDRFQVEAALPAGIYLLQLQSPEGALVTRKIEIW